MDQDANILVVDDDVTICNLLDRYLTGVGYRVKTVTNGEEALELIETQSFDLVLLDILMPEVTGRDVLIKVRQHHSPSELPIIMVTGISDSKAIVDAFKLGANDYVTKPIIVEEFIARVNNLIINKHLFDQVREQKEELHTMAMTDQLTGVYNRHYLDEMAIKYVSIAYRQCKPLSLILLDIDFFKAVNDKHGHLIGDCILTEIGRLLNKDCRSGDLLARYGGEEFIVILQDCDLSMAVQKAESIRQQIEVLQPSGLSITASFGVTTLPHDKQITFKDLFKNADQALFRAKNKGRNQVQTDVES